MSKCKNTLPRILEERDINSDALALESAQIPQIERVSWTSNCVSPEWLKRMSSVFAFNDGKNVNQSEIAPVITRKRQLKNSSTSKCYGASVNEVLNYQSTQLPVVEAFSGCDEASGFNDLFTTNSTAGFGTSRRKPDSTYISLISGYTNDKSSGDRFCTSRSNISNVQEK